MRKFVRGFYFCLAMMALIASPGAATAQTVVQIGTGTDVSPNTLYFPVYRLSGASTTTDCRSNIVFTADELTAAGITLGATITAVHFNKTNLAHFLVPASYKLYMANSSRTSLATTETWANILSSHTEVYSNASFDVQNAAGWFSISVTPFVYTGGSLEIASLLVMSGSGGATDKFQWEYTASVPADKIIATTATGGTVLNGTTTAYKRRPNIKFTFTPPPACAAPPTAGFAMSTLTTACANEPFTLSLDGNTTGSGQTYLWQSSADNVNWTDMGAPAITPNLGTSQTASTYYRSVVACSGQFDTSTVIFVTRPALVHGTFTINSAQPTGGNNFQSIGDAVSYIRCGIDGPVVLDVAPLSGPYNEQVEIPDVPGTSAINTITINGNGTTLSFKSSSSTQRAGILLNGTDYVTIDSLVIDGSGGTYAWAVLLTNAADHNTIKRCTIHLSTSDISQNQMGIMINGSATSINSAGNNGNYNSFSDNTIIGGFWGITMYGHSTNYNIGNSITGNKITDSYSYSNYIYGQESPVIASNDITRPNRTASAVTSGCYLSNGIGALIEKNRIHNFFDSHAANTQNSFMFYITSADGTTALPNKIINNLVYNIGGNGAIYGLYNLGSDSTLYYHNTIVFDDAVSTTGAVYGIYQTTAAKGVVFKNNIISISRAGTGLKRGIYLGTTSSDVASNNNVYWMAAPAGTDNKVGQYSTTSYTTLPDWKSANGGIYDQASFFVDPLFTTVNPGEYKPTEAAINNIGENLGVLTDIYGVTRNALPDPGAVEFSLDGCSNPPTAGQAITSDALPCAGALFTLNLDGNSVGAGQTYQWQRSTDNTNWSNIESVQITPLLSTSQTESHYYRAGVKCNAGTVVYSASVFVEKPNVSGNFTINKLMPTGGTNFASFSEAAASLTCGITGPVTFTVEPFTGPYEEQVTIPEISGTSTTNTVRFICNGAILKFNPNTSADRTAFILNGTDHVTIDNLVIDVRDGVNYGWGMLLTNRADSNIIRNCTVYSSTSSTSANYAGIIVSNSVSSATSAGNNGNYNLFENNTISGGYYGIISYGSTSTENTGNTFVNNILEEQYLYGMYVYGQRKSTVSGNDVSRPTRTILTGSSGIYVTNCTDSMLVEKNRVHNAFDAVVASSSSYNGIYIINCDGNAGYPSRCENNLVHSITNNSTVYGIYQSGSDNWNIHHNTVILDHASASTTSPTYGIYANSSSVNVKNNIAIVSRGGSGTKYVLNLGANFTGSVNYNNWLITSSSGTNYLAYKGSGYSTLDDWKLSNGNAFDQNSQSLDPLFQLLTPGDFYPSETNLNDIGEDVGVLTDIVGSARSTTPDPGAFEFSVASCVEPPYPGTVSTVTTVCSNTTFLLDLSGNSAGQGITYQWQVSANNVDWTNIAPAATVSSLNTSQTASSYYRALVQCKTGTPQPTPSVLVTSPGLAPAGTFTINSALPTGGNNFQSFGDAVNYIACGIAGPVTFNVVASSGPYNEQVIIPAVTNTSVVNTVTWNGNGNTLAYSSNDGGKRGTLILDGADHMIFDSLFIDATLGTYGYGMILTNSADSNTIIRCNIMSNASSTTSNFAGIVMSGGTGEAATAGQSGNGNLFEKNEITGGYYGIYLYGGPTDTIRYNKVVDNMVKDYYYNAIYTMHSQHTWIKGNDVSRPSRTNAGLYAIWVNTNFGDILVEKNRVHNLHENVASPGTLYGYNLAGAGNAAWPNRCENNLLYNIRNGNGGCYGIYAVNTAYWTIAHNTVLLDDASASSGATNGINVYGNNGLYVYNNIVSISRAGTGTKYCLYMASTGVAACNNNVLYMNAPAGTNGIGYDGSTGYSTLADWQTAFSNAIDQNSISVDPIFIDPFSGNLAPQQSTVFAAGNGLSGVTTDILNNPRRIDNPTPGAYEITGSLPVTLLGIDAVRVGADVKLSWETLTEINNKGFQVERSVDGTHFSNVGFLSTRASNGNSSVRLAYQFLDLAAPTSDVYYRLKQQDNNGREHASNVVRLKALSGKRFDISSLYPNPLNLRGGNLTLLMTSQETTRITLVITDIAGKLLKQQAEVLKAGNNTLKVNTDQLPAGSYLIRAVCTDGCETIVKKFVIQ